MLKSNKGITLIALVVTIIVLLILAGVSITMLTGDDSIINRSSYAKEEQRYASVLEKSDLWKMEKKSDKSMGTSFSKSLEEVVGSLKDENLINEEDAQSILENGYVIINDKEINFELDDDELDNGEFDSDGWDFAYVQISEGWEKINKDNELPEENIIAKFYSTGENMSIFNPETGEEINPSAPAYSIIIEGNGDMSPLGKYEEIIDEEGNATDSLTLYGWNEEILSGDFGISNITIKEGITKIGDFAFISAGIKTIKIPDSIIKIGDYAFGGCYNLISINIPNSVIEIGEFAFAVCNNLTNITIPDSLTTIGEFAFAACGSLASIDIPDSVTNIGMGAFVSTGLTSIDIPTGITIINEGVFTSTKLTSVTIPENITTIGSFAFSDCTSLVNVTISNGVKKIDDYAFQGCSKLTSIKFPESLIEIWDGAFYECSNLEKVKIYTTDIDNFYIYQAFYGTADDLYVYVLKSEIQDEINGFSKYDNMHVEVVGSISEMDAL